jgi:ribosomal protein S11
MTIVTLVDEDGDEFPIRLPGVYVTNRAADYAAALQILAESVELQPRGEVRLGTLAYLPAPL